MPRCIEGIYDKGGLLLDCVDEQADLNLFCARKSRKIPSTGRHLFKIKSYYFHLLLNTSLFGDKLF